MAKPRLIIIIRHAQSEGNKRREVHQLVPDHRIKLTPLGKRQALDAGKRLRSMLRADDTVQFYTSPYCRTRETTDGILESLTEPGPDGTPSPFDRQRIKVCEEPRLREQDFSNFQPCSVEMERMWQERADYGHFFYRIPSGESAADAYDRISGFNESLWRQFGEDSFPSVCVLVTHGLMSRVFLMKWYHFTVEYFEDLCNVDHCEFLIMQKTDETAKYVLQNKLRTWSDLRRQRADRTSREARPDRSSSKALSPSATSPTSFITTPTPTPTTTAPAATTAATPRRWGGCPNGCNHSRTGYRRREEFDLSVPPLAIPVPVLRPRDLDQDLDVDRTDEDVTDPSRPDGQSTTLQRLPHYLPPLDPPLHPPLHQPPIHRRQQHRKQASTNTATTADAITTTMSAVVEGGAAAAAATSTPPETPAENLLIKSPHFLHLGRDFGGSDSGVTSLSNSDTEYEDDGVANLAPARFRGIAAALAKASGMGRGAQANKLGDAPQGSESDDDDDDDDKKAGRDLVRAEEEDRSIEGSVY